MKVKFIVTLMLLFSLHISAQDCSYTFSGKVEDFHDKSPLVNATIFIKNQNKYAATDANGNFIIKNVCGGKVIIEVSHISCETKRLELNFNKNITKTIDLEHHIEKIGEVTIKSANKLKTATKQSTLLKTATIEKYNSANLGDALKEISGVSSINTGNTILKPVINGLHSSRVLVNINGVRLQDQDWGIEHAPNVDMNSANNITVIKGANALEYGGDAIGGVIIIEPQKPIIKDTLFGKTIATYQTNSKGYTISSSLNKAFEKGWYTNGNIAYKRFGDANAPNYNLTNTGLASKAFSLDGGYRTFEKGFELFYSYLTNEIGILKASHQGGGSDFIRATESPIPLTIEGFSYNINNPKQDVTHHLAKALFYKRFKALGKLNIQYDFQHNQRFEYDIRRGNDKFKPAVDLTLKTHTLKTDFKFDANNKRIFKVGIATQYQNNFPNPETGVRRLIPDYDKYDIGVFALGNFRFDDYIINAALRYDFTNYNAKKFYKKSRWESLNYDEDFSSIILSEENGQYLTNPVFNYHNVSASAGITYNFNNQNSVLFNYGLANRAPNPSELFSDGLHHSAARIELGSLRLKPESAHRISATYSFNNDKINIKTEGFYNIINNFIYIVPKGFEQTLRGGFPVYEYEQTNATMFGVDLTLNYAIAKNLAFENKSSFIIGNDIKKDIPLVDIPPVKTVNSIQYTNDKWRNFKSKIISEYVGRQTRFPNNNFEVYIPQTNSYKLADVSTSPKAYHLLNFDSSIDFKLKKSNLNIGFSINNILNTSYRDYLNRFRFFADDLGRNFKIQLKINY